MKDETALPGAAPLNLCKQDRISDFRTPLWRGRDKKTSDQLRRRYALYVAAFEDYMEQRRAA
jgi:hypothetical protein